MTIEQYQTITGITVPASSQALVTAQLKRAKNMLEQILGYTLDKNKVSENHYEELGKTNSEGIITSIDFDNLLPPDDVQGAYRLFAYNDKDSYFSVDPFMKLNSVKLVFIKMGDEPNGVTLRTFDEEQLRVHISSGTVSKYIQRCRDCFCLCDCTECVQLAVDADWLYEDCLPFELQLLWADMATYYANCKRDVKSETLGSHSYTLFDNKEPQNKPENMAVIKKYAGPNGSASIEIVV